MKDEALLKFGLRLPLKMKPSSCPRDFLSFYFPFLSLPPEIFYVYIHNYSSSFVTEPVMFIPENRM